MPRPLLASITDAMMVLVLLVLLVLVLTVELLMLLLVMLLLLVVVIVVGVIDDRRDGVGVAVPLVGGLFVDMKRGEASGR